MCQTYSSSVLLYIRALTPVHVGIGRGEGTYVDLPVQRDEFGFPTIWASSLKGALKANLDSDVRKYLGSEPGAGETEPSIISILDARLLFMPVRTLDNVWTYATTPHLLGYLLNYVETSRNICKAEIPKEVEGLKQTLSNLSKPILTKYEAKREGDIIKNIIINELELPEVELRSDLLNNFSGTLPSEIQKAVKNQGLIIIPDKEDLGLEIINRSMMIQYRVRLKRDLKTVEAGPWSEEYVPMETVFVSLALCRDFKQVQGGSEGKESVCKEFVKALNSRKVMYVGGKETIGRGLVKIFPF